MASKQPRPPKPRRPAVSAEDEQLFHDAIAGATPLTGRDRVRLPPVKAAIIKPDPLPPRVVLALEGSADDVSGRAPGVNRAQVAGLRSGHVRVEETLDLHGQTLAQAMPALERFLLDSVRLKRRCVLVIHGKGLHSGGVATLREAVIAALTGPLSGLVSAFATAAPADGGSGATIIQVRL